ncbi:MAG: hypothetical protein PVG60_05125, partial [Desulfarculaceae bacterium]
MTGLSKHHLRLPSPSLKDNTASIDRLAKALRKEAGAWPLVPISYLNSFASVIREADYQVTATLAQNKDMTVLVEVEPGDTTPRQPPANLQDRTLEVPSSLWGSEGLGVALDIGSTHLQASLHDLAGDGELAQTTLLNPQTGAGSDILTRIHYAADPKGHQQLCDQLAEASASA